MLFSGLRHLYLSISLEEIERGGKVATYKVFKDLFDMGNRRAAELDSLVEHAIFHTEPGIYMILCGNEGGENQELSDGLMIRACSIF